jgi:hypothetical protein
MFQSIKITLFIVIFPVILLAQNGRYELGGRANGMANTSMTLSDEWSLFNNIGALAHLEETIAFTSYRNIFGLVELNTFGAGFTKPAFGGVIGVGVFRFGDNFYNDQKINVGFSNKFGLVSLGINVNYVQINVEGAGRKGIMLIDFGGKAIITNQLVFGAFISNINQGELSTISGEKLPTIMRTGLSYRPIEGLMLNTDLEKELDVDANVKIGLEYQIIDKVQIRTGIKLEPFESSYGLGFDQSKLKINYAFRNNPDIGDIHEISLGYRFKKQ